MKEINSNRINNNFQAGMKNIKKPAKEVEKMKDAISKYLKIIAERAEREVPEYGEFKMVYETFPNTEKSLNATDFILKITKPPKTIEGHETIRTLEICAYKLPLQYKAECIVTQGTKNEILKEMKNSNLAEKIETLAKELSKDLDDMHY